MVGGHGPQVAQGVTAARTGRVGGYCAISNLDILGRGTRVAWPRETAIEQRLGTRCEATTLAVERAVQAITTGYGPSASALARNWFWTADMCGGVLRERGDEGDGGADWHRGNGDGVTGTLVL